MLNLPETGIRDKSISHHNNELRALCDWVEGSLLFAYDEISRSDVIDMLLEGNAYKDEDFARERVNQVWTIVAQRVSCFSQLLGIEVSKNRLLRKKNWIEFPAYGFCMALALAEWYPSWAKSWAAPSSERGMLFEQLVEISLQVSYPEWQVKRFGWAPDAPVKLQESLPVATKWLSELPGAEVDTHLNANTNDLGLDMLAFRSYGDDQAGFPVLMIQCATGKNWKLKRHAPDLAVWRQIVSFVSNPVKGFVIPFAFTDQREFRGAATPVKGIFIERTRLLYPFKFASADVISKTLNDDLTTWTRNAASNLPQATE